MKNKKALYESIMTSVAKQVKKALNEEDYLEVYTNAIGQRIAKAPDAEKQVTQIGAKIARLLKDNLTSREQDIMASAISEGMVGDQQVSPKYAINSILMPWIHRTLRDID